MKQIQQRWAASSSNKKKLTAEDAKFIFEQAEKQVEDSIETAVLIVGRTNTLLNLIATIVIGTTAYVLDKWQNLNGVNNLLAAILIGDCYLFILGFLNVLNIQPLRYHPSGSLPKDLMSDSFFHDSIPNDQRIIRFYVSEFEDYQARIEMNNRKNAKRWKKYKIYLWAFLLTPLVFLLSFYLLTK